MKPLTAAEIARLLLLHGWVENAGRGSHRNYRKDGVPFLITVPFHKGRRLPTGTQLSIMRIAGISRDEL